jgi:hypothetical protein
MIFNSKTSYSVGIGIAAIESNVRNQGWTLKLRSIRLLWPPCQTDNRAPSVGAGVSIYSQHCNSSKLTTQIAFRTARCVQHARKFWFSLLLVTAYEDDLAMRELEFFELCWDVVSTIVVLGRIEMFVNSVVTMIALHFRCLVRGSIDWSISFWMMTTFFSVWIWYDVNPPIYCKWWFPTTNPVSGTKLVFVWKLCEIEEYIIFSFPYVWQWPELICFCYCSFSWNRCIHKGFFTVPTFL